MKLITILALFGVLLTTAIRAQASVTAVFEFISQEQYEHDTLVFAPSSLVTLQAGDRKLNSNDSIGNAEGLVRANTDLALMQTLQYSWGETPAPWIISYDQDLSGNLSLGLGGSMTGGVQMVQPYNAFYGTILNFGVFLPTMVSNWSLDLNGEIFPFQDIEATGEQLYFRITTNQDSTPFMFQGDMGISHVDAVGSNQAAFTLGAYNIPEPSAFLLSAIGMCAALLRRRR